MPIQKQTQVGPYEVLGHVATGGMGDVFRARDKRIGRDVAIKFLVPGLIADAEALARFEREARAAGSINHPNLVTIYDIGMHESSPYIVMEMLEGSTLRERLDGSSRGPTTSKQLTTRNKVLDYAAQIAAGLAAAHERGIIHRDLKPENIFITRSGHVKILDFGVARFSHREGIAGDLETLETEPGKIIGTVAYMAPEHLLGGSVDHRSDIFSLGVLLYEMLGGERPFGGESMVQTIASILRDDPEPLVDRAPVSPGLWAVVRRCLEKSPDERFQSARDVAFALEAALASNHLGTRAEPPPVAGRSWRNLALGALLAVLVLAAGFGVVAAVSNHAPRPMSSFVQLTFDAGLETEPCIAPDGSEFVYVSRTSGNADIWVRRVGGDKATNLTADSTVPEGEPVFSPDGRQIAFRSERDGGGIFVMGATGESVRRMTDFGHSPAWSPDGRKIAFATESISDPAARIAPSRLYVVEVESGRVSLLFNGDAVQPNWSPDGSRIAYWGLPEATSERAIWTIPATGGTPTRVTDPADRAINWKPVWSPDGEYLYYVSDRGGSMNIWRVPVDQESGAATGDIEQATRSAYWCGDPSLTRDGKTLAFSTRANAGAVFKVHIDRRAAALAEPEQVVAGSRQILSPVPSPDGEWVALSTLGVQEDVFIVRSDGSGLRQLTNDSYRDRAPRWSPDGNHLIFHSDRAGKYTLWSIRLDGSGLRQITPDAMTEGIYSPDGSLISAVLVDPLAGRGAKSRRPVLLRPKDPAKPLDLPPVSNTQMFWPAAWSPDGRRLVGLTLDDAGFQAIAIYSLATRQYAIVSKTAERAGWLDDQTLVLIEGDGMVSVLNLATRNATAIGVLPLFNPMRAPNIDARTGTIYYVSLPTEADIWSMGIGE